MNATFNLRYFTIWCIVVLLKLTTFGVLCKWDFSDFNDVPIENDNCTSKNGQAGVCRRIENCQEVLRTIRNGFKICSFDGFVEIVCCPNEIEAAVRISEPTETTQRISISKPREMSTGKVYLAQYQEGMACPLQNGKSGICARAQECAHYMESDTRCGFIGNHEVVCCTMKEEIPTESPFVQRPFQSACRRFTKLMSYSTKFNATNLYVAPEEFPHMGSLIYGSDAECGSSLISESYAITAAQCVSGKRPEKIRFNSTLNNDMYPLDVEIEDIIVHPLYNKISIYHDLALIKLKKNPVVIPFVVPACLQQEVVRARTELTIIGWGHRDQDNIYSETLTKTHVLSVPFEACQDTYRSNGVGSEYRQGILQGQTCSKIDRCTEDQRKFIVDILGSPLQLVDPVSKISNISGIASYGQFCQNMPTIYTSVAFYLDWIESIVWPSS